MSNELEGLVARSESLQLQHEAESHRGIFGLVGADLYAVVAQESSKVELRAVTDGALVSSIAPKDGAMRFAASPDGERLATWGYDRAVRLFDRQGKELAHHEGFNTQHGSLGWTGDGSTLFFGCEREPLRAFSRDGKVLASIAATDREPVGVLQPAGAKQALGHDSQQAWLADVATGKRTTVFERFGESIGHVAAHGDALAIATRDGVVLRLPGKAPAQKVLDALRKEDHAFALKVLTQQQKSAKKKVNRDSLAQDLKVLRARIKSAPKLDASLRLWSAGGWTDDVAMLDERSVLATTPAQLLLLECGAEGVRQTRLVTVTEKAGSLASIGRVMARGTSIAVVFPVVGGDRTRFYRLTEGRQSLEFSDFAGAAKKPAKKPSKKK